MKTLMTIMCLANIGLQIFLIGMHYNDGLVMLSPRINALCAWTIALISVHTNYDD